MLSPRALVEAWIGALNSRQADRAAELYSPAARVEDEGSDRADGRAAVLSGLTALFREIPDLHLTLVSIITEGTTVAAEIAGSGTTRESGRRVAIHGAGFLEVERGRIRTQRFYWELGERSPEALNPKTP